MGSKKRCPECGSDEIIRGSVKYTAIIPYKSVFSKGTDVTADVCSQCGLVVALRALDPEKVKG